MFPPLKLNKEDLPEELIQPTKAYFFKQGVPSGWGDILLDEIGFHLLFYNGKETYTIDLTDASDIATGYFPQGVSKADLNVEDPYKGSFTIVHGPSIADTNYALIYIQNTDSCGVWVNFLTQIIFNLRRFNLQSVGDLLQKQYYKFKAQHTLTGKLPLKTVLKLFHVNKLSPISETFLVGKRIISVNDLTHVKMENFNIYNFYEIYCHYCVRHDMDEILSPLSAHSLGVDLENKFVSFILENQYEKYSSVKNIDIEKENAVKTYKETLLLMKRELNENQKLASPTDNIKAYLYSSHNPFMNTIHQTQPHDMNQPLNHYFINSSHNTYLNKWQINSKSSVEMYRQVLLLGCRCIELDIWDGPQHEPIITHGHALCTSISFKDVLKCIKKCAFVTSEFPVILSFENHCGTKGQRLMVKYIKEVLGSMVLQAPLDDYPLEEGVEFPSPAMLKNKILIKNRKNDEDSHRTTGASVCRTDSYIGQSASPSNTVYMDCENPNKAQSTMEFKDNLCVNNNMGGLTSASISSRRKNSNATGSRPSSLWGSGTLLDNDSNETTFVVRKNSNVSIRKGSRSSLSILTPSRKNTSNDDCCYIVQQDSESFENADYKSNEGPSANDIHNAHSRPISQLNFEKDDPLVINDESTVHAMGSIEQYGTTVDTTSTDDNRAPQDENLMEKFRDKESAIEMFKNSKELLNSIDVNDPKSKELLLKYMQAMGADGLELGAEVDEDVDGLSRRRVLPALSHMVNYIKPTHMISSLQNINDIKYFLTVSSLSENTAFNYCKSDSVEMVRYNKLRLTRIYPKASRYESTNYNPQMFWNYGCQMVALNFQTPDTPMHLNNAKFVMNNYCGYLLKPVIMRDPHNDIDPLIMEAVPNVPCVDLSIKVISAQFINDKKINSYVVVETYGIGCDTYSFKTKTTNKPANINVMYQSDRFVMKKIVLAEMVIIRFAIYDEGGKTPIAQKCVCLDSIQNGYRHIPMDNLTSRPLPLTTLFVYIQLENHIPEGFQGFIDSLENPEFLLSQVSESKSGGPSNMIESDEIHTKSIDNPLTTSISVQYFATTYGIELSSMDEPIEIHDEESIKLLISQIKQMGKTLKNSITRTKTYMKGLKRRLTSKKGDSMSSSVDSVKSGSDTMVPSSPDASTQKEDFEEAIECVRKKHEKKLKIFNEIKAKELNKLSIKQKCHFAKESQRLKKSDANSGNGDNTKSKRENSQRSFERFYNEKSWLTEQYASYEKDLNKALDKEIELISKFYKQEVAKSSKDNSPPFDTIHE